MIKIKYTHIIEQFLDGEMTAEQEAAFKEQVKTDPDLAREVEVHLLATEGIQYFQENKAPVKDIEKEIKPEKPWRKMIIRRLLPIAASILLIVGCLAYIFGTQNPMADTTRILAESAMSTTKGDNPATSMTLYERSVKLFKNKEYESAIKLFDQVIEEDADKRAAAKFFKADALYRLGRKNEVSPVLESIDKESPLYDEAQDALKEYR